MSPMRSLRACAYPGCGELVRSGYCTSHRKVEVVTSPRDPRVQRLYDRTWQKRRNAQLAREPWCKDCMVNGIYTPATEVHHEHRHRGNRVVFNTSPLTSLCDSCHSKRTAVEVRHG